MIAKRQGLDRYSDDKMRRIRGTSDISWQRRGVSKVLDRENMKDIAQEKEKERQVLQASSGAKKPRMNQDFGFSDSTRIPKKPRSALNRKVCYENGDEDEVLDKRTSLEVEMSEELDYDAEEIALIRIRERRRSRRLEPDGAMIKTNPQKGRQKIDSANSSSCSSSSTSSGSSDSVLESNSNSNGRCTARNVKVMFLLFLFLLQLYSWMIFFLKRTFVLFFWDSTVLEFLLEAAGKRIRTH